MKPERVAIFCKVEFRRLNNKSMHTFTLWRWANIVQRCWEITHEIESQCQPASQYVAEDRTRRVDRRGERRLTAGSRGHPSQRSTPSWIRSVWPGDRWGQHSAIREKRNNLTGGVRILSKCFTSDWIKTRVVDIMNVKVKDIQLNNSQNVYKYKMSCK